MRRFCTVVVFCVVVWLASFDSSSLAGQQSTPAAAPASTKLTKVDLIVTDENDRSVHDIRADDLELTYEGALQKISYFAKVEKPVISAVAVDTSHSFKPLLPYALTAVRLLLESNRPNDETMLIRFTSSGYIETVAPFTSDKSALLNITIDNFSIAGGQSAILDAVYLAAEAADKHKPADANFRRAAVLISDGEDRASYYSLSKITKLLNEMNVQVFLIGMTTALTNDDGLMRPSTREKAERLLAKVAKETGGRVFFPRNPQELFEAVDEITKDLRSQYVVGFERNTQPGEKGYQKFKLRIAPNSPRPKLKTITRPGFWLSPPDTKTKK